MKAGTTYSTNISLMFPTVDNTTLTWTSSAPEVIDETGKYSPVDTVVPLTLTARLQCGDYYWEQEYNIKAQKEIVPAGDYLGGLVAYYNMDATPCYNAYNEEQRTTFGTTGTRPALTTDYDRFGKVLHQAFGANKSNSFTRMPNPLLNSTDLEGFTVSMWVKRTDANMWDAIWCFFNGTSAATKSPYLFLTGNAFVGYNDNAETTFDINYPTETPYTDIPVDKWTLVTVTVGLDSGVRIYINGVNKTPHSVASSTGATKVKDLPLTDILSTISGIRYFYLGMGSPWGSADCYIDDVMIYNRELPATDVRTLYTMANRVTDFTKGEGGTGIEKVKDEGLRMKNEIFDLQGRRVARPTRGLYIKNGKKILVK